MIKSNNEEMQKKKAAECIIVFTKNRPLILSKTIQQLLNIDLDVIILDDSTSQETKNLVSIILDKRNNIYYHGGGEQMRILQNSQNLNLDGFIRPLGHMGWNTGFVRNYALILSKVLGYKKVLFMDDDIVIRDIDVIRAMMRRLNNADFVGAKISGMPDDSIVGHIMRSCGIKPHEFISTGFLALTIDSITEYFLNYYNEDWIWLFLHNHKAKAVKYGEVYQLPYNPFENAIEKSLKQELGEVLVEGVQRASESNNNFSLLLGINFWDKIVDGRITYIEKLIALCKKRENSIGVNVGISLLKYLSKINRKKFVDVFVDYYSKKELWVDAFHNLKIMGNRTLN